MFSEIYDAIHFAPTHSWEEADANRLLYTFKCHYPITVSCKVERAIYKVGGNADDITGGPREIKSPRTLMPR